MKEILAQKKLVDKEIKKYFVKTDYKLLEKFVLNGGKRLRPIILLNAYKGCGGKHNILRKSLSVEFFHNSTLIHDDIMDEDEVRRNKPTIYKKIKDDYLKRNKEKRYKGSLFNRDSSRIAVTDSILLGNLLFTMGGELLKGESLEVYNEAYRIVNEGQIADIKLETKNNTTEKEYLDMSLKKTGNLVKASIEIGAILAGAKKARKPLSKFALDVAVAFQIRDDLMDIDFKAKKGREFGSDIKKGKKTLLVIKAIELGSDKQRKTITKYLGTHKVKKVIQVFDETGATDYCEKLSLKLVERGKKQLLKAKLNSTQEKYFLKLADYLIKRKI